MIGRTEFIKVIDNLKLPEIYTLEELGEKTRTEEGKAVCDAFADIERFVRFEIAQDGQVCTLIGKRIDL